MTIQVKDEKETKDNTLTVNHVENIRFLLNDRHRVEKRGEDLYLIESVNREEKIHVKVFHDLYCSCSRCCCRNQMCTHQDVDEEDLGDD